MELDHKKISETNPIDTFYAFFYLNKLVELHPGTLYYKAVRKSAIEFLKQYEPEPLCRIKGCADKAVKGTLCRDCYDEIGGQ